LKSVVPKKLTDDIQYATSQRDAAKFTHGMLDTQLKKAKEQLDTAFWQIQELRNTKGLSKEQKKALLEHEERRKKLSNDFQQLLEQVTQAESTLQQHQQNLDRLNKQYQDILFGRLDSVR
jgi:septation ring formation regulator EzrA